MSNPEEDSTSKEENVTESAAFCDHFCKYKKTYYFSYILLVLLMAIFFFLLYKMILSKRGTTKTPGQIPSISKISETPGSFMDADIETLINMI